MSTGRTVAHSAVANPAVVDAGVRRSGRQREDGTALAVVVVLLLGVTGAGLYWSPRPSARHDVAAAAVPLRTELVRSAARPVGTSGTAQFMAVGAELPFSAIIRDIETITGSIDGHELIGRRVDLRVPVVAAAGDIGFWVGPGDNRVLVVTRDRSRGASRDRNRSAAVDGPVPAAGETVAVTGMIKPLPDDAASAWKLPAAERSLLNDHTIYIHAN